MTDSSWDTTEDCKVPVCSAYIQDTATPGVCSGGTALTSYPGGPNNYVEFTNSDSTYCPSKNNYDN